MPNVISLFSGGGGIDLGFKKAKYEILYSTDCWDIACETLKTMNASSFVECADVRDINFKRLKMRLAIKEIDVLVGGPPCPAYSKSRFYRKEKKRALEDENSFTLIEYFRAVEELKPNIFFFENVHGFIYKPHRAAYDYLIKRSEELGYVLTKGVVNAADYGVPQTRERFICVGVKKGIGKNFIFPETTHYDPNRQTNLFDNNKNPWVTCGDVLSDLDIDLDEDELMQAGSKHKDLLKLIPPGENYLFFTKERNHPNPIFKWRSRYWSFLLKLSPNRPSWTIQASFSNNMGPFHWKSRFLRIPEIKKIQTFDDEYHFTGNFREQWRQVGNAVPPRLAEVFATAIRNQLL